MAKVPLIRIQYKVVNCMVVATTDRMPHAEWNCNRMQTYRAVNINILFLWIQTVSASQWFLYVCVYMCVCGFSLLWILILFLYRFRFFSFHFNVLVDDRLKREWMEKWIVLSVYVRYAQFSWLRRCKRSRQQLNHWIKLYWHASKSTPQTIIFSIELPIGLFLGSGHFLHYYFCCVYNMRKERLRERERKR